MVITGVSGSGKSSLAFDTLYAEGHRRYVESLSVYARQFLDRMERPALDSMDGICPAVAIRQRAPARNPRSTVATATEIHDHLRLLFAKVGRTVCPTCASVVSKDTAETVADRIRALPEGARAMVLFPTPVGGTPLADLVDRLRKRGFRRLLAGEDVGRPGGRRGAGPRPRRPAARGRGPAHARRGSAGRGSPRPWRPPLRRGWGGPW